MVKNLLKLSQNWANKKDTKLVRELFHTLLGDFKDSRDLRTEDNDEEIQLFNNVINT